MEPTAEAGPVLAPLPGRHGWDRIVAGARFLSDLDPGWWREDALLPANLAAVDAADPYRCVLAWWAAQHLPAPLRRGPRQVPPYDRAVRALRLSPGQAQDLGFAGVDADRLTVGWRHLVASLRESYDPRAAVDPAAEPVEAPGVMLSQRIGWGLTFRVVKPGARPGRVRTCQLVRHEDAAAGLALGVVAAAFPRVSQDPAP